MNRQKIVLVIAGLILLVGSVSSAAPIQWTAGNQHYYEMINVPSGINWDDAVLAAESTNYLGENGYLATITSSLESGFITATFPWDSSTWIGGFQLVGSPEPGGGWQWVTGDASAWRAGDDSP